MKLTRKLINSISIAATEENNWSETNIIDVDDCETDNFYEDYEDFIPPSPVPEETSPFVSDKEKR